AAAAFQRLAGVPLERVELEAEVAGELGQLGAAGGLGGPPAGRGVPLGGTAHNQRLGHRRRPYAAGRPRGRAVPRAAVGRHAHREAYVGLARTVPTDIDGLAEALYERLLVPQGWQVYEHTVATLAELRARDVPVVVVSNIGFDIRPITEALGFHKYVEAYAL